MNVDFKRKTDVISSILFVKLTIGTLVYTIQVHPMILYTISITIV